MSLAFEGTSLLPVPLERVWHGLNDPDTLRRSIVGCTELERADANAFVAVMTAKVGPIAVQFRGHVQLEDIDPMKAYTLSVQAKGGAAGFGRMRARITLTPTADGQTELRYQAEADVGGKLASVGQRLIQSVAQKQANDFFARFTAVLTGQAPDGLPHAEQAPVGATASASPTAWNAPVTSGGLSAPVPAWLVVFGAALGAALGYCIALLH